MSDDQITDCSTITPIYQRDPSFDLWTGCPNLIDRDFWNSRLDQRTFLLKRPPVQHINYPKATDWCNMRRTTLPILTDPQNSADAQAYYEEYLQNSVPKLKNTGLPTTSNDFCSFKEMCNNKYVAKAEDQNVGTCLMGGCFGADLRNVGRRSTTVDQTTFTEKYPVGVTAVKRNIDAESSLRRLDYYCPRDTSDRRLGTSALTSQTKIDALKDFIPDCVDPLPGICTPLVWRNVTSMRMRYLEDRTTI